MGCSNSGGRGSLKSAAYKQAYDAETSDMLNFAGSFALETGMTKDNIGYEMYVYQSVTGTSLIAHTKEELRWDKNAMNDIKQTGKSYGMTDDAISGAVAGIKAKMKLKEKAIRVMESSRNEYEKFKKDAAVGNAKSKKRNGKWM